MDKEQIMMVGFAIIANAGAARSNLMQALQYAKDGNFEQGEELVAEAKENIKEAHRSQTELLKAEASGENNELSVVLIHAQDHLMTTILLQEVMQHLIELYRRTDTKERQS